MFINTTTKQLFNNDGYVVLPLLVKYQVEYMQKVFAENPSGINKAYYTSIESKALDYKIKINEEIRKVIHTPLQKILENFRLITGSFVVKKYGIESLVHLHSDWSFSDESIDDSIIAWIPLQDTYFENGAMQLVKGSHLYVPIFRGPGIENPLEKHYNYIRNNALTTLHIKAGEVLLMKSNLLHCSSLNKQIGKERIAIRIEINHVNKKTLIFWKDKTKTNTPISSFEIDEYFFTKYQKGSFPKEAKYIKSIPYIKPVFSRCFVRNIVKTYSQ